MKKRILLGVCGGIAAYKSIELVRLLKKNGAEVRVVLTKSALEFVTPLTFQSLSGQPVHTDLLDTHQELTMSHIHLARWADCLIIAPATANMIAKMAHGLADDLLSTLFLAAECPIWIAPAMNQAMWAKAVTQSNIHKLEQTGIKLIGPESGVQACGESGLGRMIEPAQIYQRLMFDEQSINLQGVNILITAGPTREPIDPVRFISNRSSGKMGYALAQAAAWAGANATLVSGPVNIPAPTNTKVIAVETAKQMYSAVIDEIAHQQIYIGAAAVADFSPLAVAERKLKKQQNIELDTLQLQKNPDIISAVSGLHPKPFTVGFAAETDDLESYATAKLDSKNLDMIAANWVGREQGGFDSDNNALQVYWRDGHCNLPMTDKQQLAKQLLKLIAERFHRK